MLPKPGNPAIPVEALVLPLVPLSGVPRKLAPTDHSAVESAMERAGVLEHRHKRCIGPLRRGRRKVCPAMVLAQDTPIVLMDEAYHLPGYQPTSLNCCALSRELADSGKRFLW